MEEKAGNYKEYPNHFQLTETHIRKIHSVMEDYAEKIDEETYISIYIERENDSFFTTRDLEKILADENSRGRSIETLSMEIMTSPKAEGSKNETEKERSKAYIAFTKEKDTKVRFMTSYKERDWCFLLIDELDTQVQRLIKGKSISLFKAKIIDLVVALAFILILVGGFAWNTENSQINLEELLASTIEQKVDFLVEQGVKRKNTSSIWFIPGMAMTMLIFLFILEFKPITKLVHASNTSVFYWGDMIPVYDTYVQKRTRIKWSIIIAFGVSLSASLAGSLFL